MSKMKLLDALEAEKLMKQKRKQYCGTPCTIIFSIPSYCMVLFGLVKPLKVLSCCILTVQDTLVYMTVHTRQLSYEIEMFSVSLLAEMKFGQFKCYI